MTRLKKTIFLTGFMGAGKTTVGNLLAGLTNSDFIDLDEVIVQKKNKSITDIFNDDGERYFRDCESSALFDINSEVFQVVATGGGIVLREENRNHMKNTGYLVYLRTSWPELKERLLTSTERPLVAPDKGWDEVKALWENRQPLYEEADLVVETDNLKAVEVAQIILNSIVQD